jgi:hypothetical protein
MDSPSGGSIIVVVALVFFVIIVYGTVAKTKWGINLSRIQCPTCGKTQSRGPRVPADAYEAKWGGMTCADCATKMDKWGRARA